jgi:hypothetical protein
MNCPNCGTLLSRGEVYFKKAVADLVAFGLGGEDLRIKTEVGEDLLLLSSSERAAGQFCGECGVIVIATEKGRRSAVRKIGA